MKKVRVVSAIMLAVLFLTLFTGCDKKQVVEKETEITVTAVEAIIQDISQSAAYSGIIRGQNEVYIVPKTGGRVIGIHAEPGDKVYKGQTLITLDSSDYAAAVKQAQAGQQMAEINLQSARDNLERITGLYEAGAVSDKDFEASQTAVRSAEVAVQQANAALEQVRTQINNTNITSPISGTLGSIALSLGDMANPASPAAVVSDTSRLEVEILVSESEIGFIAEGSEVDVRIKAMGEQIFKGTIANAAEVADPIKRNFTVKVVLDNPDNKIKSGMFAEVIAATVSKQGAVCVPVSAVVPKGATMVVYVVDEENRARERQVTTGIESIDIVEITEGIKDGEKVITKGNTLVDEGTLVRVVGGGVK